MYASQTLVGSHAAKLVGLAEAPSGRPRTAPDGEQEWLDFLEAFHRHAYFLGALSGAGSEVGRALRTLQMVQKVGAKTAARNVKDAAKASAKTRPCGRQGRLSGARHAGDRSGLQDGWTPPSGRCSSAS
jgi:hypothetical protein